MSVNWTRFEKNITSYLNSGKIEKPTDLAKKILKEYNLAISTATTSPLVIPFAHKPTFLASGFLVESMLSLAFLQNIKDVLELEPRMVKIITNQISEILKLDNISEEIKQKTVKKLQEKLNRLNNIKLGLPKPKLPKEILEAKINVELAKPPKMIIDLKNRVEEIKKLTNLPQNIKQEMVTKITNKINELNNISKVNIPNLKVEVPKIVVPNIINKISEKIDEVKKLKDVPQKIKLEIISKLKSKINKFKAIVNVAMDAVKTANMIVKNGETMLKISLAIPAAIKLYWKFAKLDIIPPPVGIVDNSVLFEGVFAPIKLPLSTDPNTFAANLSLAFKNHLKTLVGQTKVLLPSGTIVIYPWIGLE